MACLHISCSGWTDPDIFRTIPPGYHLVWDNPPGQLHHLGSCGLSRMHSLHRDPLYDAAHAQQASPERCYQEDESARLGKFHPSSVI